MLGVPNERSESVSPMSGSVSLARGVRRKGVSSVPLNVSATATGVSHIGVVVKLTV